MVYVNIRYGLIRTQSSNLFNRTWHTYVHEETRFNDGSHPQMRIKGEANVAIVEWWEISRWWKDGAMG